MNSNSKVIYLLEKHQLLLTNQVNYYTMWILVWRVFVSSDIPPDVGSIRWDFSYSSTHSITNSDLNLAEKFLLVRDIIIILLSVVFTVYQIH